MRKNQQCDFRSAVTRTERKPHHSLCLGKSWSARVLWENRYLVFVNSHGRFFFSSTSCSVLWPVKCTSPSSGALVPTETKARIFGCFFLAVLGVYFLYGHFSISDKWGLLSACRVHGFSLQWLLWLWSTSSRHTCFSSFATQAQYLSFSLVAPWHVRSSQNKDRTHVSRIGKLTFYHAASSVLGKLNKQSCLGFKTKQCIPLCLPPTCLDTPWLWVPWLPAVSARLAAP